MRSLHWRTALIITAGLAAGPWASAAAEQMDVPATDMAAEKAAIRNIGQTWQQLYTSGNYAAIPDLYTEDTLVMPRGRPLIQGRGEMRKAIGGLAAGRRVAIDMRERELTVAGDYAWFVGDFTVTYTPRQPGEPATTEDARSFVLFRRDADGTWRIHRDMDSPAPDTVKPEHVATGVGKPGDAGPAGGMGRNSVTQCDRIASSRYDRTRLAPPVARAQIDVPAAIRQCLADLDAYPGDPRIHFHLGRLYGYAGERDASRHHREQAAAAGNHNAVFLLGYLNWIGAETDADRCASAAEMKRAADMGNYSAQITYASYSLEGRLQACDDRANPSELAAYLSAARPQVDGFFETRLADHLLAELAAESAQADEDARQRAAMARMAGTWVGTFRRFDANGALVETLPSRIIVRFPDEDGAHDYHQTNILTGPDGKEQRIESYGRWDGAVLRFSNDRMDGMFREVEDDPTGRNSVLLMQFKDGSGLTLSEIISLSPDGQRRMRVAQYMRDGMLVRRTLVDEQKLPAEQQ